MAEPGGRELAERVEALRRETAFAREAQQAEIDWLRILGELVLPDPALARLWWMEGKPEKLTAMVEMDHVFERAAALVKPNQGASPQDPVPGLIHEFLRGLGPEHRDLLLRQLQQIFLGYERSDLADLIDLVRQPAAAGCESASAKHTGEDLGRQRRSESTATRRQCMSSPSQGGVGRRRFGRSQVDAAPKTRRSASAP